MSAAELYSDDLRRYFRSRMHTAEDAEDAVQDVFLHVARAKNADDVRHPRAFLFAIARNIIVDRFRKKSLDIAPVPLEEAYRDHPDPMPSPERQVVGRQEFELLCDAVEALPEISRRAIVLYKFYGYSYQEIGQELGLSNKSVEKHLMKALMSLGAHMRRRGAFEAWGEAKAEFMFGRLKQGEKS